MIDRDTRPQGESYLGSRGMELSGRRKIAASRETVYTALNDIAVLRRCIPGCRSIEKIAADKLRANVSFQVGPVRVSFDGAVTLSDLDPPNGLTITGSVSGGTAGCADGAAAVALIANGATTSLDYHVTATIGGMATLLGTTMHDRIATRLASEFLSRFEQAVAPSDRGKRFNETSARRAPVLLRAAQKPR